MLVELSLLPLLAQGYSAHGSGCFVSYSYPLITHSTAIACLKHCSLPLSPLPFQKHRKKDTETTEAMSSTLGPFLQAGDEICLEDLQNSVPALLTVGCGCKVVSFSEQLLRVSICLRKNKHTPSNNNPTNKQALRDQQFPKTST